MEMLQGNVATPDAGSPGLTPEGWYAGLPEKVQRVMRTKAAILALPPGCPRPQPKSDPLGYALCRYINPSSASYDYRFEAKLRRKFPHWFRPDMSPTQRAILALPTLTPRPQPKKHPLGYALNRYIGPSSPGYDQGFVDKLRIKFPHWFQKRTPADNMAYILSLPPDSPKPHWKNTYLGRVMQDYIHRGSGSYNEEFRKAVEQRFPHWFPKPDLTAGEKRAALLGLPEGSPRPNARTHPLGRDLIRYTNRCQSGYHAEFDAAVRAKFPHWFIGPQRQRWHNHRVAAAEASP